MEKLKEDIAKFNKDYLIGKPYQESIYVKKEMNNFIQQNDSMCRQLCLKKSSINQMSFNEKKCYMQCMRKIKEVDEVVNQFILEKYMLWKYNSNTGAKGGKFAQ